MKETKKTDASPVFRNEAVFRRKLDSYFTFCQTGTRERMPSIAGFCRFCNISRAEYAALGEAFPHAYDVAESAFIDEALNAGQKPVSGSVLSFVLNEVNGAFLTAPDEAVEGTVRVICEHDAFADGV